MFILIIIINKMREESYLHIPYNILLSKRPSKTNNTLEDLIQKRSLQGLSPAASL